MSRQRLKSGRPGRKNPGMRVLVTGGSGFLGSFTVERLQEHGHSPVVLDLGPPVWTPGVPWVSSDVAERERLKDAFASVEPDAVIHLAGLLGTSETFDHPQETVRTNVIGSINILEQCVRREIPYVGVQTGTPWRSPYAISKRAATDFARGYHEALGLRTTVLRVFNGYGPRQDGTGKVNKIVPRFAVNALTGLPLPIFGDGRQSIDLVHAEDCAECFVLALERGPGRGEVIDVGTGKPISVIEVAKAVIDIVGRGELEFLPRRLGEGTEYPVADTSLARELLGFVPDPSLDRLKETVEWYRENVVNPLDRGSPSVRSS